MIDIDTQRLKDLPPGGNDFLEELTNSIDAAFIKSVLFFGSTVTGNVSNSSDIDFIIILTDDAPAGYRTDIERSLERLSALHLETTTTPRNRFERIIQQVTGTFQSGFVAKEDDVVNGRFHAIFNTSVLVYWLSPWRTVMASVFDECITVYGEPIQPEWDMVGNPTKHSLKELSRSLLMTYSLSMFQIIYSIVSGRGPIYSQQAYKWSIYNITYHINNKPAESMEDSLQTVPNILGAHKQFKDVRATGQAGILYQLKVSFIIILIHMWAMINIGRNEES